MNYGPVSTAKYFKEFIPLLTSDAVAMQNLEAGNISVELYVPTISLQSAASNKNDLTSLVIGAQNINNNLNGAFTGETSVLMLNELNIKDTLIGHSERRHIFKETDEELNLKAITAIENGVNVIFCVGELIEERRNGDTLNVIISQLDKGLKNLSADMISKLSIAYEPVWAIGTGETASSADAQEVCSSIRKHILEMYTEEVAEKLHILYGGSVKPHNTAELLSQDDIDGLLIGGASLKANVFMEIINNAI